MNHALIMSRITSLAIINPATDGTNEILPKTFVFSFLIGNSSE
jgi:hypothetical protein